MFNLLSILAILISTVPDCYNDISKKLQLIKKWQILKVNYKSKVFRNHEPD